ncbi:MAG: DUF1972 domain-containing protein [Desulfobacterales bacterium]|nr:DUF1972 domain-containing protein [Desulfobacterales bacterium]
MKIAIMGTRGIPACYSGFETFAEQLSVRLVKMGHEVTVYCRSNIIKYPDKFYKGVRLVILPTISHKYLDTVVHTFLTVIHSLFQRFDVAVICNAANGPFAFIPRIVGTKILMNPDGPDYRRNKWGGVGKLWFRLGEITSLAFANEIVSDAIVLKDYFIREYKRETVFIPYGSEVERVKTRAALDRFGLEPDNYILYVSRLEPENNAHLVVGAFEKTSTNKKLVIVGDAPYNKEYIAKLKQTKDPRIIFTGFLFGNGYQELQSHAHCYIQATSVGGTHPALIEAMGFGNCVIANDTPEHIEVTGDAAVIFDKNSEESLRRQIDLVTSPGFPIDEYRQKALKRMDEKYSWEKVARSYEALFLKLCGMARSS